ncbi:MAG: CBS domain-containing protein [Gemmatimonadota bacterium]|nr:CBS domain-containing protein [Gemmatimonadota bacterium]
MGKKARDIMTTDVVIVDEDTTINNLIETFIEHKISCAPVLNGKKKLTGIVTKTDVLGHFLDIDLDLTLKVGLRDILDFTSEHGELEISSVTELKVSDIMTPKPVTARESAPVESLAETMVEHGIHRLIITKGKAVTGIVSSFDLIYYVAGIKKDG